MSWTLVVVMVFATALLAAQESARPAPAFDVASIRPTPPNPPVTTFGNAAPGGRWSPRNLTALMIVNRAYPEFSLAGMTVGGPSWIGERRFDIDAKTEAAVTPADYPQMVRQLLADRFRLKVHVEPRPLDVYSLKLARTDGRFGPGLRPGSAACTAELEAVRERLRTENATAVTERRPLPAPACNGKTSITNGIMRIAGGRSIGELVTAIQVWTDLKVVDQTGLRGDYEMDLEFDPRGTRSVDSAANADTRTPSLFTALQEQLGLKLERNRQPVDVLVIDSIEMPSEN